MARSGNILDVPALLPKGRGKFRNHCGKLPSRPGNRINHSAKRLKGRDNGKSASGAMS